MATAESSDSIAAKFDIARRDFLRDLSEEEAEACSKFTSIDDVYDATDDIQKKQGETRTLRNLGKIQPYLECLNQYSGVLDTVVQIKPSVLAVIWAPLKLVLVVSSSYMKSFSKVLESMAQTGAALPHFKAYTQLFAQNGSVQRVLELFFKDILDFHLTVLSSSDWRVFFESLWPKYSGKFQVILNSITHHRSLLDGEVTLAHITEAHAARALAHNKYEKDQEHDERIEFQNIKNDLSPHLFDSTLEKIRQRCSVAAGQWLEGDERFLKWKTNSNRSSRVLWLTGIPEAGKTFLSSVIVTKLQDHADQHHVAFVFLSHQSYQENLTLTVLHSLMFQLMIDDKSLRPLLSYEYENNYRKLTSSPEFIKGLLRNILENSPVTFFVLDGLDEVVNTERAILLAALVDLQSQCPNLKLLLSSRAEYDINLLLSSRSDVFYVHRCNTQDIENYVDVRTDVWLSRLDLDHELMNQVRQLTKHVAQKSKGMFLYARLFCDGLERLSDPDDIQDGVQNLPQGLNEAYSRILDRIDRDLSVGERAQARTILEWVSCSIVPVSQNEIQVALSVANGKDPFQGRKESLLNVIQRCGPIIEINNDNIEFVHFSAKEFLFSAESYHYLDKVLCNTTVANICLKYLCTDCFDPTLSDNEITGGILRGAYILQDYVASYWLQQIINSVPKGEGNDSLKKLIYGLEEMVELRENQRQEGLYARQVAAPWLKIFEGQASKKACEALFICHSFLRKQRQEFSLSDGEKWVNQDPLTISTTQLRVFRLFEAALCPAKGHREDCKCNTIKRHYGPRPFKCNRFGCQFFRTGFESAADRNRHISTHDRPYRCDQPSCEFGNIGFSIKSRLNAHLKYYENHKSIPRVSESDIKGEYYMHLFLVDAVEADNVNVVRAFSSEVLQFAESLICHAAKSSSLRMLELLLEISKGIAIDQSKALYSAVDGDNMASTQLLLDRGASLDEKYGGRPCIWPAMSKKSPKMVELLLQYDNEGRLYKFMISQLRGSNFLPSKLDLVGEANAITCLGFVRDWSNEKDTMEELFKMNASRSCSVVIANFFLQRGVDVNSYGRSTKGGTALYFASARRSQRAAELMKLLLESGADPVLRPGRSTKLIADKPGPRNIQKWFGITWEQLVENSAKVYAASLASAKETGALVSEN